MTNAEAIEHLKNIKIYSFQDGYTDEAREALDMAIKALEAQEQVAPINAKLEAISEKLRDIYKANVEYDAKPLSTDLPTIVICFICNAQYFYITHCFNVEELLNIPVELIVHRLVAHTDDSILKMYKK